MKKLLSISLVLLTVICIAQPGHRIGAKGGVAYTSLLNSDLSGDNQIEMIPSYSGYGGVSYGYNATHLNIGLTIGAFLKQYNQEFEESAPSNPSWNRKLKVQYLEFPILFRMRPAGDKVRRDFSFGGPYFEIGGQISNLLSAALDSKDSVEALNFKDMDISNSFESFNAAAVIGFGFHQVGTMNWSVTHGVRATYMFMDAVKDKTLFGPTASAQSNWLSVGYILSIAYKFDGGSVVKRR